MDWPAVVVLSVKHEGTGFDSIVKVLHQKSFKIFPSCSPFSARVVEVGVNKILLCSTLNIFCTEHLSSTFPISLL